MTGLALGLMLGAGLFLVWSSFWVPPAERRVTRNRMRDRLADEMIDVALVEDIERIPVVGTKPKRRRSLDRQERNESVEILRD